MTDRKLKRILQEQPFLIDDVFVRSSSEAAYLFKQKGYTVAEFVERAKKRSSLPLEAWSGFDNALVRKNKQNKVIDAKGTSSFGRMPRFLPRAAVVFVAVILLVAFFTLTKPGIALAQSIYRIVVSIVDGDLRAEQLGRPEGLSPLDFEHIPEQASSLEEAAEVIGRPVVMLESEDVSLTDIRLHAVDDVMVTLRSDYQMEDRHLCLMQTFYEENQSWGAGVSVVGEVIEKKLPDGNTMYFGYMDDGTAFGEAYAQTYDISLTSEILTVEELIEIADSLNFIE